MKIGIDSFWYFDGYASLKRVTQNLVDHLLKYDGENEYVIFLDKRFIGKELPYTNERTSFRYLKMGSLKYNFFTKLFLIPYYTYRDGIDIMITQYYPSPFGRGKSVSFVYDILFEEYPSLYTSRERFQLWPQKLLTKMADLAITISETEKLRMLEFGYKKSPEEIEVFTLAPDEKFKTKDNFSELQISAVKKKYGLGDQFLLYVGLLSGRKNLDNLLRAVPLLDSLIPLVIIGKKHPSYPSNHLELIDELAIAKRVIFTGFVSDDELATIYSISTIFCFPSFAEGFGLPPLEALAAGVPVAASNRTSIPEVCGDAACYFNPESPTDIAFAINRLLKDKAFYKEKQQLATFQAASFNWQKSAFRLIDFFNSIKKDETNTV